MVGGTLLVVSDRVPDYGDVIDFELRRILLMNSTGIASILTSVNRDDCAAPTTWESREDEL